MRRWTGVAERKTPGGNLRVYVDRNDSVLDAVLITGDYFTRDLDLARIESALRFVPVDPSRIHAAIGEHQSEAIYRVSGDELVGLILSAAGSGQTFAPDHHRPLNRATSLRPPAAASSPTARWS